MKTPETRAREALEAKNSPKPQLKLVVDNTHVEKPKARVQARTQAGTKARAKTKKPAARAKTRAKARPRVAKRKAA